MNTLNSETFGEKLYNTLPSAYRTEDSLVNYSLKRYIEALSLGGFANVIDEVNGLQDIVDPDKISANLLPILFENYGMEIFNGLPEVYLRKLLPLVSDLYSLKGSITSVEYITSLISGVKSSVVLEDNFSTSHTIDVRLEMDFEADSTNYPDKDQLKRIIDEFIPFYCNAIVVYTYIMFENSKVDATDVEDIMEIAESMSDSLSLDKDLDELLYSNIKQSLEESGSIQNIHSTLSNHGNFTLSNNFYTNGAYDYDKITQGGQTTVQFSI